jgi:hypothetical protein
MTATISERYQGRSGLGSYHSSIIQRQQLGLHLLSPVLPRIRLCLPQRVRIYEARKSVNDRNTEEWERLT